MFLRIVSTLASFDCCAAHFTKFNMGSRPSSEVKKMNEEGKNAVDSQKVEDAFDTAKVGEEKVVGAMEDMEEVEKQKISTKSLDGHMECMKTAITALKECEDYKTAAAYEHFVVIFEAATIKGKGKGNRRALAEFSIDLGLADLFNVMWDDIHSIDLSNGHKKAAKGETPTEAQQAMVNLKKMKNSYWNFTDCSKKFSECLLHAADCGCVKRLLNDLEDPDLAVDKLKSDSRRYLIKGSLGILHNIARLAEDGRCIIRSIPNSVKSLQNCSTSTYLIIQAKCNLVLSFIFSDEEAEGLATGTKCIGFLVGMLRESLNYSTHVSKKYGFSAVETVQGLNQLAMNDSNKVAIADNGAIPLLTEMLGKKFSEEEQLLAAQGLWRLAFAEENKGRLMKSKETIEALIAMKHGSSMELMNTCKGALWEIFEGKLNLEFKEDATMADLTLASPRQETVPQFEESGHIMISYQWDVQERMINVKEVLEKHNYKVWMDIEKMEGDILGAMADAVESSEVVLVCFTQKYKKSHSTRTEATYAYKCNKSIIPLMLEEDYQPDGWLGALIGTLKYFKLYDDELIETEIPALLAELGSRGKKGTVVARVAPVVGSQKPSTVTKIDGPTNNTVVNWSTTEVKDWLIENNLENIVSKLEGIDGPLLTQMKKQLMKAPEFFHQNLQSGLKLDYISILRFTRALDKV